MKRERVGSALIAVFAVAGLILSGVAVADVAAQQTTDDETDFTVDGLRQLGTHPSGAPPSMRPTGDAGGYWLKYSPTGLFQPNNAESTQPLEDGQLINRDSVWLHSFRGWGSADKQATVHVVKWQPGTETVRENGSTVEREVPTDVVHKTVNVSLAGGTYDEGLVKIPSSNGETSYITMWLDGQRSETQWVFQLKSSRAAQSIPIESAGGLVMWGTTNIGFWFVGTAIGSAVLLRWLTRDLGTLLHVEDGAAAEIAAAGVFALLLAAFVFYNGVIDTLVQAPYLIGVLGGLIVGIIVSVLYEPDGREVYLLQLLPDGNAREDASGHMLFRDHAATVYERDDGKLVMPREGYLSALARAWPGVSVTPLLEFEPHDDRKLKSLPKDVEDDVQFPDDQGVWGRIRSRLRGDNDGENTYDEIYLIDPLAEDVVEYEPETWELHTPSLLSVRGGDRLDSETPEPPTVAGYDLPNVAWGKLVAGAGAVALAYFATSWLVKSTAWGQIAGTLVLVSFFVRPTGGGTARAYLAPFSYDAVVSNMTQLIEGYTDAADAQHFQNKYREEKAIRRAESRQQAEAEEADLFSTLNDELAPDRQRDADSQKAEGVADDD